MSVNNADKSVSMSGNFNYRGEIARERVEASERCRGGAIGARLNLRTTLVRNFDSRYIGGGGGQMASMSLFHASRLIERLEWQAFLPLLVYLAMRQSSSEKHSRDSFFFRTQKPKGKVSLPSSTRCVHCPVCVAREWSTSIIVLPAQAPDICVVTFLAYLLSLVCSSKRSQIDRARGNSFPLSSGTSRNDGY